MNKNLFLGLLLIFVLLLGACGPKGRAPESVLDTPEAHYANGIKYIQMGKAQLASDEFQNAIDLALNKKIKFAPGYEGMALCHILREDYKSAEQAINDAFSKDGDYARAYATRSRIKVAKGDYKGAVKDCEKAIDKTEKYEKKYVELRKFLKEDKYIEPYYLKGQASEAWAVAKAEEGKFEDSEKKYDEAEAAYKAGVDILPTDVLCNESWKTLQDARRATAGMTPVDKRIARVKEITRADVASLFSTHLDLPKLLKKKPASKIATFRPPSESVMGTPEEAAAEYPASDIHDSWARLYITEVIEYDAMEVFPDGTFKPMEKVTRANFAMMIQTLLIRATNDEGLETRFIGNTSPFPDVMNSHYAFNSIMTVTTRGIIKAKMDGTFGLMDSVSGTEALEIIKALKQQL